MQKCDLKNCMVVETDDGIRYLVMLDRIITTNDWEYLGSYNDDLTFKQEYCISNKDHDKDIKYVYRIVDTDGMCELYDILCYVDNLELIWEREHEIDYDKVPEGTKVQVRDRETDDWENAYFISKRPVASTNYPYLVTKCDDFTWKDEESNMIFRYIRLHPSVTPQDEWMVG